ncbi:kinase-like domain-containing protein [Chytriomyces sp. MP71]|nr:kinase-like domain-containing protein [Chytriomyces sp. MP71]
MILKPAPSTMPSLDLFVCPSVALKSSTKLYQGLTSEEKARAAVKFSFSTHPNRLNNHNITRVVGYGANGVCLAGTDSNGRALCLKVIYRPRVSSAHVVNAEVEAYRNLSSADYSPNLLSYVADWQDECHIYLVCELFGSDWSCCGSTQSSLEPLVFSYGYNGATVPCHLSFCAGASDLWAYRDYLTATRGNCKIPITQIKQIIRQAALGLSYMHSRGYYHGDVKAENILLESCQGVKIADLGSAKHVSSGLKAYGTVDITPPELLNDSPFSASELDGRDADIFALGLVLVTLLNESSDLPAVVKDAQNGSLSYKELIALNGGIIPLGDTSNFDKDALHLLSNMMEVEPAMRYSVAQVLSHRFLQ